ncbi:MAG: hypothetical protein Q9183_002733 [Haloplaca sp. 2 TL-2023]
MILRHAASVRTESGEHESKETDSGIRNVGNLRLASRELKETVTNSILFSNEGIIHINRTHLIFLSKTLSLEDLCRFTPPAYSRLIRHWRIIIHYGGHIPHAQEQHLQPYAKVCRTVSWVCGQLARNETPIQSIKLEIHHQCFFVIRLRDIPNPFGVAKNLAKMSLLGFHAQQRAVATDNSIGIILSRLRGGKRLQVTVDGRSREPTTSGLLQDNGFYLERVCAKEEEWNELHARAKRWMKRSKKLKDQVYGLWNLISKREAFAAEKSVIEESLEKVSKGKAPAAKDLGEPAEERHDVYPNYYSRRYVKEKIP